MKPNERIYRIALARLNVEPNEAVFVDDSSENIIAARDFGMAAVHFTDPQQARRELMILDRGGIVESVLRETCCVKRRAVSGEPDRLRSFGSVGRKDFAAVNPAGGLAGHRTGSCSVRPPG